MKKLFGTDGIRGIANQYPMTSEVAVQVGRAVAQAYVTPQAKDIIIAQDTRQSAEMLASGLISGILSAGGNARPIGVAPTPAVASLTQSSPKAVAGVMISASHNPYQDNGIKIFKGDGYKLTDAEEAQLESTIESMAPKSFRIPGNTAMGKINTYPQGADEYTQFLLECTDDTSFLKGINLVLDCSHGATYQVAPRLFESLGAKVEALSNAPNGTNINENCGSQHPQKLADKVRQTQAHAGLAFDGDGDRLIAVDERGQVLTGDQIILSCANHLKSYEKLLNNTVVTTVMSNLGLRLALKDNQIHHAIADVGDRYVLEMMKSTGACLGGEDSGHMIFLGDHVTGDGILSGIRLLEAMVMGNTPLSKFRDMMKVYPQVLINVQVREKPPLEQFPIIMEMVSKVEAQLGDQGRVLLRYSGTSSKCRIMVEGPDHGITETYAKDLADIVESELGHGH
jgi:phosphoglucosamine mutase